VEQGITIAKEQDMVDRTGHLIETIEDLQKLRCRFTCQAAGYSPTTLCRVGLLSYPCNFIFPAAGLVAGILG